MASADYRLMTEATGQRIATALENLAGFGSYLTTTDVVNNLTSTETTKALSAAQGKALNDRVEISNEIGNSASVASGAFVTVDTFTPTVAGFYIIMASMSFDTATSGNRILLVDTFETDTNTPANSVFVTGRATLQKVRAFSLTPSNTVYIRAYQTSGSAVTCASSYRVVRIK